MVAKELFNSVVLTGYLQFFYNYLEKHLMCSTDSEGEGWTVIAHSIHLWPRF